MFDRFTDRAKRVMNHARQEALRLNHEYLGTEHILLGLIQQRGSVATTVLEGLGASLDRIRDGVEEIVKRGPTAVTMGQLPFTPRAKRVLELSFEEAAKLLHRNIGTEHVLLGLIAEKQGVAAEVLRNLGLDLDRTRAKVSEVLLRPEFLAQDRISWAASDSDADPFARRQRIESEILHAAAKILSNRGEPQLAESVQRVAQRPPPSSS